MRRYSHKGFTLLELIVVMIILSVIMSIAVVKLFSLVEFSRSTEAITAIDTIRKSVERCYLWKADYDECWLNTPGKPQDNLDIEDPGNTPGSHFTYKKMNVGNPRKYRIEARRNTLNGGNNGDFIRYDYFHDGKVKRSGSGAFESIK